MPPTASPAPEHRARWSRVGQNAGANLAAKVATGLCTLALVPLLVHRLGIETFGWLSALMGFVALAQFGDLGLALALQGRLADLAGQGREEALQNCYRTGSRLLHQLGLLWTLGALPLALWLGPRVLPAPAGVPADAALLAWAATALAIGAGVGSGAGQRLAIALQQSWVNASWTAAGAGLALAVIWWLGAGPAAVGVIAVVIYVGQFAPGWCTSWQLARSRGWQDGPRDAAVATELRREGLRLASANLAGAALTASVPFLFARFGGYGASALFAALQRLVNLTTQTHSLLLTPLAPATAEAAARGDARWLRHAARLSLGSTVAIGGGLAGLALVWPWLGPRWLGAQPPVDGPALLVWGTMAWAGATLVMQACSYLLLGLGRLAEFGPPVALGHLVTLALAFAGGWWLGAAGVALALAGGAWAGPAWTLLRGCRGAMQGAAPKNSTNPHQPPNL